MIGMINGIAELWWSWMGPMLWQVSLLIVIIGVIDRLIRRWAWPEVRHALWLLILIKLVVPPSWSFSGALLPHLIGPVTQRVVAMRTVVQEEPSAPEGLGTTKTSSNTAAASTAPGAAEKASRPATHSQRPVWQVWAFGVWLLGMAVVTSVLLTRTARLRRWHEEQERKRTVPPWFLDLMVASAQRLKLERLPAIVFSEEVAAPAVYGVFHPVLLLPTDTASLSHEEAEHILLHELAHLKRGDLWWHGLTLLLQIIYWFNPLLLWARRQIKHVRELCCDLTVANLLREKTMAYRKTLMDTARRLLSENTEPALALLGVFEEPFRLVARLRWLEKETWRRRTPALLTATFVLAIGVPLLLPMASAADIGSLRPGFTVGANLSEPRGSVDVSSDRKVLKAVYIRNEFSAEELVMGIPIRSKLLAVSETWVGDDIIAGSERGRTVIVDRRRHRLTYIDHKHRFWTETPLPLDLSKAMSEHSMATRLERRSSGEVSPTRQSRRILGRKCRQYDVHSWYLGDGRIHTEEFIKVWASNDVPFDLALYYEMLLNMRLIYNRDAVYRSELEKIEGLQMGIELGEGNFFSSRRYSDEAVVLEERTPPPGTFSTPVGYERRDRIEDLEF